MNMRYWKTAILALGVLLATQSCALFVDVDGDHRHFRHHHRGYWRYHSSLQQPDQPFTHDLLARQMPDEQER